MNIFLTVLFRFLKSITRYTFRYFCVIGLCGWLASDISAQTFATSASDPIVNVLAVNDPLQEEICMHELTVLQRAQAKTDQKNNYTLTAQSTASDIVEIFAGDGPQNARRFISTVTVGASGTASASVALQAGETYIMATATATDAAGNTSELGSIATNLSLCMVTNLNDAGPGSLREAINCANSNPDLSTITFSVSNGTITLATPLPDFQFPFSMNGTGQNITINGNSLHGFQILSTAQGSEIAGLTFQNFTQEVDPYWATINVYATDFRCLNNVLISSQRGVYAHQAHNILFSGNLIGVKPDNTRAGNNVEGLNIRATNHIRIGKVDSQTQGNVISDNGYFDINLTGACTDIIVRGNKLGTDITGNTNYCRSLDALMSSDGCSDIIVGGTGADEGNIIAGRPYSGGGGLEFNPSRNVKVIGNKIGVNIQGATSLMDAAAPNSYTWGISLNRCINCQIGGSEPGEGNTISGFYFNLETLGGCSDVLIVGNKVGTNQAGTAVLGRAAMGMYFLGSENNANQRIQIGGSTPAEANIIAGSTEAGIFMDWSRTLSTFTIEGNYIGINPQGTSLLNPGRGIWVYGVNNQSSIGGSGSRRNIIATNGQDGILIVNNASNRLSQNVIYNNGPPSAKAINLRLTTINYAVNDGGHRNGPIDLATAAPGNTSKAAPVLSVVPNGSNYTLTVQSTASDIVEIFAGDGPQNARRFISTVTAGASGTASASVALQAGETYIMATATDAAGNTSELGSIDFSPVVCTPGNASLTQCTAIPFSLPVGFCAGNTKTVQVQLSDRNATTFTNPTIIGSGSQSPLSLTIPSTVQAGTYQLRLVTSNGFIYPAGSVAVQSCAQLSIAVGRLSPSSVCISNGNALVSVPFTTTGTFPEGQIYTAELRDGQGTLKASASSATSPISLTVSESGQYIVRVTGGAVISSNTMPLQAVALPAISLTAPVTTVCKNEAVTLTAQSAEIDATYTFKTGSTILQSGYLSSYTTTSLTNGQAIVVEITTAAGCKATSAPLTFTIKDIPLVQIASAQGSTCGSENNGQLRFSYSGDAVRYTLLRYGTPVASHTNLSLTASPVTVTGLSAGSYQVQVESLTGCTGISEASVIKEGGVKIDACLTNLYCSSTTPVSAISFRASYSAPPAGFTGNFVYRIRKGSTTIVDNTLLSSSQLSGGEEDMYQTINGENGWAVTQTIADVVEGTDAGYVLELWAQVATDPNCANCGEPYCIATYPFAFRKPVVNLSVDEKFSVCGSGNLASIPVGISSAVSSCSTPFSGYTLQVYKLEGATQTEVSGSAIANTTSTTEISASHTLALPGGRYRIVVTIGSYGCNVEKIIEIIPANLDVAVATTRTDCDKAIAAATVTTTLSDSFTYRWYKKKNGVFELLTDENDQPLGGYQLALTLPGEDATTDDEYKIDVSISGATGADACQASTTFTVGKKQRISDIIFSENPAKPGELNGCALTVSATVPLAGEYRVAWYTKLVYENTENPPVTAFQLAYTDFLRVEGTSLESSLAEKLILEAGDYYVIIYDQWNCEVTSQTVRRLRPKVNRTYAYCLQWESPVIEQERQTVSVTSAMPALMASQTKMTLESLVSECIERRAAEVAEAVNPERCLEGVNDQLEIAYEQNYHHYTLYYYDRSGSLTKTVPPEGVKPLSGSGLVRSASNRPAHDLFTTYEYNSLGQLLKQTTPDGGSTYFVYNQVGQLRFSQNERQRKPVSEEGEGGVYSYTKYDELGRVVEVGQAQPASAAPVFDGTQQASNDALLAGDQDRSLAVPDRYPSAAQATLSEQTVTVYSDPDATVTYLNQAGQTQRYLQNRVSYSYTLNRADNSRINTYYSYDPHGNVEWLAQDMPGAGRNFMRYEYDLISGKVLKVRYNEHRTDRLFHQYFYDEDNRLTRVETSRDGLLWDRDASYQYYQHGPLRRTELGNDHIQGLDYVYTLHGWLKGINAPTNTLTDDAGQDGAAGSSFSRDEFSMGLGYYAGDYKYTGSAFDPAGSLYSSINGSGQSKPLYNGNISSWVTRMNQNQGAASDNFVAENHFFEYDRLNRIRSSNRQLLSGTSAAGANVLKTNYTYDANGNLLTLNRWDHQGNPMDNLTYSYATLAGKRSNRLGSVADAVGATAVTEDIEGISNYTYDPIGNLVTDSREGIRVKWNVYGKVSEVEPQSGSSKPAIRYRYDAAGNRVAKLVTKDGTQAITYYVRDASGNVMATYTGAGETSGQPLTLLEQPLYGSDRIGQLEPKGVTLVSTLGNGSAGAYSYLWTLQQKPAEATAVVLETPNSAELRVSGLKPGTYVFRLAVTSPDGVVSSDDITLVVPEPVFVNPLPGVRYDRWDDISGSGLAAIPVTTPASQTDRLNDFTINTTGTDNFGMRLRAYLYPDQTGSHTFKLLADEQAELYLSVSDDPSLKRRIIAPTSEASSAAITLEKNRKYYIEVLYRESTGNENLSVQWQEPGSSSFVSIPGSQLSIYIPPVPSATNLPPVVTLQALASRPEFILNEVIPLQAQASDPDGTIGRVDFYANQVLIGSATQAPFQYTWTASVAGSVNLTAVAIDDQQAQTTSAPLTLTVTDIYNQNTATPGISFVRGININGPAVTVDGRAWQDGTGSVAQQEDDRYVLTSDNLIINSASNGSFENLGVSLLPPTDANRTQMIRAAWGSWDFTTSVTGLTANTDYLVYLYVWEDYESRTYDVRIENSRVVSNAATGAVGSWKRLGPFRTNLAAGRTQIDIWTSINLSGIEIWQVSPDYVSAANRPSTCASGSITREVWTGLSSTNLGSIPLTDAPTVVQQQKGLFKLSGNFANTGNRFRGYICPPVSGNYSFQLSSSYASEVWLSNSDNPGGKVRIVSCQNSWQPLSWENHSEPIYLLAGRKYYIEALYIAGEGNQGPHFAVGWTMPDGSTEQPIKTSRLSPFEQPGVSTSLYRAINIGGTQNLTIDGNTWEFAAANPSTTGNAPNLSYPSWAVRSFGSPALINPPTDAAKLAMLGSGMSAYGQQATLTSVPNGTYDVYAYTFHNGAEANVASYELRIEGHSVRNSANPASPWSPGTWERVGPVRVTVTDGDIQVFIIGALCGLEVYRVTQAELPPPIVDAGPDVTLVDYTTSVVLQGQVQESYQRIVGWKSYELKDHLGNVRVVVGDEKLATLNGATLGLRAAIRSYANYYPFGMNAPDGNWSAGSQYRYGFNGKEQDTDFLNNYDYGFRIYNPTIAKFLSVDPLAKSYPELTPYQFAGDNPIGCIDLDGLEPVPYVMTFPHYDTHQPVLDAPDASTAAKNAANNTVNFLANIVHDVLNIVPGTYNQAASLINGDTNLDFGSIYGTIHKVGGLLDDDGRRYSKNFGKALKEDITNLDTYEGAAVMLVTRKLGTTNFTPKPVLPPLILANSTTIRVAPGSTTLSKEAMNYRLSLGNAGKGGFNIASVEYLDEAGKTQYFSVQSVMGGLHSEKQAIVDMVKEKNLSFTRIRKIYTERQPCKSCGSALDRLLPNVPVEYSFPYDLGNDPMQKKVRAIGNAQHSNYVKKLFKQN